MRIPGVFKLLEGVQYRLVGPTLRRMGKRLVRAGDRLAGDALPQSTLQPNPTNLAVKDVFPQISPSAFVGTNSVVAGNVEISPTALVLFNNIFRASGTDSRIFVGEGAYVMDHAQVKADGGKKVHIGHKAIISSHAVLHNCQVGKGGFVGMRSVVQPGAVVSDYAGLAAGSVLESGDVIPTRQYWAGSPAQYLREITEEEVEYFKDLQENYSKLREIYKVEFEKPGAIYGMDPGVQQSELDVENVNSGEEFFEQFEEALKESNYSSGRREARERYIRLTKFQQDAELASKNLEILYDGNQPVSPAYLNEQQRTNHVENEIKRNLEYDPERMRMRTESYEQKLQQIDDSVFKRKF